MRDCDGCKHTFAPKSVDLGGGVRVEGWWVYFGNGRNFSADDQHRLSFLPWLKDEVRRGLNSPDIPLAILARSAARAGGHIINPDPKLDFLNCLPRWPHPSRSAVWLGRDDDVFDLWYVGGKTEFTSVYNRHGSEASISAAEGLRRAAILGLPVAQEQPAKPEMPEAVRGLLRVASDMRRNGVWTIADNDARLADRAIDAVRDYYGVSQ
jgi:hypothetical protein